MSYPSPQELLALGLAMSIEELGLLLLVQHGPPTVWRQDHHLYPTAQDLAKAGALVEVEPGAFGATELGDNILFQLLARRACG